MCIVGDKVFRPPNPWTVAIMNVLAELHREPEMKLNLKFEIEVLCKNLLIDINVSCEALYFEICFYFCLFAFSLFYFIFNSCYWLSVMFLIGHLQEEKFV
jgi:hypothetical protein